MYHRSISEKKTNSFATIISTPEPGKQSFDLQAAVQFIPCSCHELHGAVWASQSGLQLINWLQQLARVPRVTRGSIIDIPSISCTHQSCFPTPLPSSCLAQSLCETRVQDFPFLPHLLPSGISCGHNSHGGNADKGHLRGKCWSGEGDLDREGSRAGSFPEIPWWNKLTTVLPSCVFTTGASPSPRQREQTHPTEPWEGTSLFPHSMCVIWTSTAALLGQLLRAQTPPGSSEQPKPPSKAGSPCCEHAELRDGGGKQCCDPLSSLGHSPGWAPRLLGALEVTNPGVCHSIFGTASSVAGKTSSLRAQFSCSPLCSLLSPLLDCFTILPLSAAILLVWELCRREKQTDQCLMLCFLLRSLFSFLLPLHQY